MALEHLTTIELSDGEKYEISKEQASHVVADIRSGFSKTRQVRLFERIKGGTWLHRDVHLILDKVIWVQAWSD